MLLKSVRNLILITLIAKPTWCFHVASLNCHNLPAFNMPPAEDSLIRCSDSNTIIAHSSFINSTISSIAVVMDPGWVEIKPGDTALIPPMPEPVTSCLSSIDGSGGVKSITNTDAVYLSAGLTLKAPLISILLLQYALTPGISLRVRLSRIMEYGCTAQPGQTVQILQKFDQYNLTNWKVRPINFAQGTLDMVDAKGWITLPATTVVEENETIMCVTDPARLQCRE